MANPGGPVTIYNLSLDSGGKPASHSGGTPSGEEMLLHPKVEALRREFPFLENFIDLSALGNQVHIRRLDQDILNASGYYFGSFGIDFWGPLHLLNNNGNSLAVVGWRCFRPWSWKNHHTVLGAIQALGKRCDEVKYVLAIRPPGVTVYKMPAGLTLSAWLAQQTNSIQQELRG